MLCCSTLAENGDSVTQWPQQQQQQMGPAYTASQQQFGSSASLAQDMQGGPQDQSGDEAAQCLRLSVLV